MSLKKPSKLIRISYSLYTLLMLKGTKGETFDRIIKRLLGLTDEN